jgi:hypothetical protein
MFLDSLDLFDRHADGATKPKDADAPLLHRAVKVPVRNLESL